MTERFMVDDCGTLIDMQTRDTFDYVSDVCDLLNMQHETIHRLNENIDELLSVDIEEELLKENKRLRKAVDNCQFRTLDLLDYIKEKETVTHQEIKDWWNSKVME